MSHGGRSSSSAMITPSSSSARARGPRESRSLRIQHPDQVQFAGSVILHQVATTVWRLTDHATRIPAVGVVDIPPRLLVLLDRRGHCLPLSLPTRSNLPSRRCVVIVCSLRAASGCRIQDTVYAPTAGRRRGSRMLMPEVCVPARGCPVAGGGGAEHKKSPLVRFFRSQPDREAWGL